MNALFGMGLSMGDLSISGRPAPKREKKDVKEGDKKDKKPSEDSKK
ncbi:MAG: hypothetical protein LBL47_01385 [Lactobacillus sp.]|jgi:hypothetical protein|nr:hypothetical protein [Lactobacillus sp.]